MSCESFNISKNDKIHDYLYTVRAMYLGNEPMGELLEGENGSDVIQAPLKRTILRTQGHGKECNLSITNDSLVAEFLANNIEQQNNKIVLPIDMLAYCGALRQLPFDRIKNREFETLDKTIQLQQNNNNKTDPPLFVTIFRSFEKENTLYCHSFVLNRDEEAMELVKLVMEIYYTLIRLQEMEENNNYSNELNVLKSDKLHAVKSVQPIKTINSNLSYKKSFNEITKDLLMKTKNNKIDINAESSYKLKNNSSENLKASKQAKEEEEAIKNFERIKLSENTENINQCKLSTPELNDILCNYNNTTNYTDKQENENGISLNNQKLIVSAKDIISNESNFKIFGEDDLNKGNIDLTKFGELNEDKDPIVIKKENNEQVFYKQNVFIRWLQPPTPPPPAPIIIREVQEPQEELTPLVIYKQAPRPETPPPLVIRERPPTPIQHPVEPLIIEKRIAAPEKPRKIIIEHLPAPPPKPRDIILEKWLPKEPPPRSIYYQRALPSGKQTFSISSSLQQTNMQEKQALRIQRPIYEIIEQPTTNQLPSFQHKREIYEIFEKSKEVSSHSNKNTIKNGIKAIKDSDNIIKNNNKQRSNSIEDGNVNQSSSTNFRNSTFSQKQIALINKGSNEASSSNEQHLFNINDLYSSNSSSSQRMMATMMNQAASNGKTKVAGYRIIRQIIPGPNSTDADIERALARSQYIKAANNAQYYGHQPKIRTGGMENNSYLQYDSQKNYQYETPLSSTSNHNQKSSVLISEQGGCNNVNKTGYLRQFSSSSSTKNKSISLNSKSNNNKASEINLAHRYYDLANSDSANNNFYYCNSFYQQHPNLPHYYNKIRDNTKEIYRSYSYEKF